MDPLRSCEITVRTVFRLSNGLGTRKWYVILPIRAYKNRAGIESLKVSFITIAPDWFRIFDSATINL